MDKAGAGPTGNVIHIELVTIRIVFPSLALFSFFLEFLRVSNQNKRFQEQHKTTWKNLGNTMFPEKQNSQKTIL